MQAARKIASGATGARGDSRFRTPESVASLSVTDRPLLPLFDRLLAAVATIDAADPNNWLPFWLRTWKRGGLEPVALPRLAGPAWALLREDADDEDAPGLDQLVLWRPDPARPWEECPVLLLGPHGDLDLVAGSLPDFVGLTLLVGNLLLDLPRDAAALRSLASTVQAPGRRALERLRESLGLEPVDVPALGARLAAVHAAIDPQLDPPLPPKSARRPHKWPTIAQGPRFAQAFQGGRFQVQSFDGRRVEVSCETREVARLVVGPTGKVVVGDLLTASELAALPLEVAPGEHPVFLSLARFKEESRVAAMALVLDDAAPARWEAAWTFDVDAGVAGFADAALFEHIQGEDDLHSTRLQRALARHDQPSWSWAALGVPGQAGNLVVASSGWGDGIYTVWIGREAGGRAVAVVAGFAIVPGDEVREDAPAAPESAEEFEAGELAARLEVGYNRVLLGKGDLSELGELFAPEVVLTGPDEVSGRLAVLRAIATERRLGDDPISIKEARADGDRQAFYITPMSRPTIERGRIRATLAGGMVARLTIDLVPVILDPEPTVAKPEPVPPGDVELAEALGKLENLSPVKRVLVDNVRRQALALKRPLSEEQRKKAREILGR